MKQTAGDRLLFLAKLQDQKMTGYIGDPYISPTGSVFVIWINLC